jgi:recombinational DNA repair protein (RecF pathway)
MVKRRFRHPVKTRLSDLEVPYTENSFVVRINAHGVFGVEGIIPIAYFGYIEKGIFYVVSYSYSVQHLSQSTREAYNENPRDTAMIGLEIAGTIIRGG